MKLHEIQKIVEDATKVKPWAVNGGLELFLDASRAEMAPDVERGLSRAGVPYKRKKTRKTFLGAVYFVPLKNVGTAFAADWEFA